MEYTKDDMADRLYCARRLRSNVSAKNVNKPL